MNSEKPESTKNICPECGGDDSFNFNPFGVGSLLDEHVDVEVDQEELGKRLAEAREMAKLLGGRLPGGIEGELEDLIKPKLTWQDFMRFIKARKQNEGRKNNWSLPRRKPLMSGLFVPKKKEYSLKFLLAYDCSGSMTKQQITYGISQVTALGEKGEGYCVPWDHGPYYDCMVKIQTANASELRNAKYKGGGGTVLTPLFESYEKEIGKVDLIIIVSDFMLADLDLVKKLTKPKDTDVIWLSIQGDKTFKPPFGRLFTLYND